MKIRRTGSAVAVAATGALLFSACSTPADDGGGDDAGINQESALTIAWEAPLNELNLSSVNGNATQNSVAMYLMNGAFNYYNADLELVPDESFGTYEKISDDPLTVEYTVGKDTKWSDGTKFDATDILLTWASTSGVFNTVEAETDDEGNIVNQDEVDAGVYFDGTDPAMSRITKTPEISEDGSKITVVYDEPFADWESTISYKFVPAHVVGQQALDVTDAQEAKDAVRDAILDKNNEDLSPISAFWNSGFEFTSMPSDKSLTLSNGAYTLEEYKEGQYLTLKANPDYKGDRKASIDTVTIRYIEDSLSQVQALENGEVQLIGPQASADVRQKLEAISGVETHTGVEGTYEHVDLVFANEGPFDPATYGGDAEKAKLVRQAFLLSIPRQTIVDNLIVPLNPDAEVRNSQLLVPGAPGYDEMVAANGSDFYPAAGDIEKAKELLAQAGVTTPIDVRFAYNNENPRRANQYALISDAAAQAGFNLVDTGRPAAEWGTLLGTGQDKYDASLFGWQSTSTAVTESEANFVTGGLNNYGKFSNPEVDAAYAKLAVTTDPDEQLQIQMEIEKILWEEGFGATIFQFPAISGWTSSLSGAETLTINPTIFYGFWNWKLGS